MTETMLELLEEVRAGRHDDELVQLLEAVRARRKVVVRERDRAKEPTHVIVGDVRPRYLQGTKGRAGGWISESRREFWPAVGTEAYARGRRWKITGQNLQQLEATS
jgi:hypothetical protein